MLIIAVLILIGNLGVLAIEYIFVIDIVSKAPIGTECTLMFIMAVINMLVYIYAITIKKQGRVITPFILIAPMYLPLIALVHAILEVNISSIDLKQWVVMVRVFILLLQLFAPILSITSAIKRLTKKPHLQGRKL